LYKTISELILDIRKDNVRRNMELIADLFDLQYFRYEEIAPNRHVILIKNTKNGSGAY